VNAPLDGMPILQWAGIIIPTLAVFALFLRFGAFLKTVQRLEMDVAKVASGLESLTVVATELRAWRDATKDSHADLLARVRRLEDRAQ
jgi:hypothetical protein